MKLALRLSRRQALTMTALLLAVALALGFLLVRAEQGGRVLVATRDLAAGQVLGGSDFSVMPAKLGPEAAGYLQTLPAGAVLTGAMRRGELLNGSRLASQTDLGLVHIAIDPSQPLATDVRVGARVSLWFMPKQTVTAVAKATAAGLIASDIQVLQISKNTDALGSAKTRLEIEVSPQLVPAIIAMQAQDGNLSVIAQG